MFERHRINFVFLNIGHFLDHFFMLIFATVAALVLATKWGLSYAELIPYATPGFVAFGVGALPMGYLADKWSRPAMIAVFFLGIGLSAVATGFARSPLEIGIGLFVIGVFAAIYHPVGIAMVVHGRDRAGVAVALNGVFGNFGVAAAALITGAFIDLLGWRAAFVVPGLFSVAIGLAYVVFLRIRPAESLYPPPAAESERSGAARALPSADEMTEALRRNVLFVILFTTALGGLIFQSTTFALPKVLDERLDDLATHATQIGLWAFFIFTVAGFSQLLIGWLIDNRSARSVFVVVALFQAIFFAIMMPLTGLPAVIVSLGFMFVVFGQIPINDVLIGRVVSAAWRSRAYAIRSFVTFTVMATSLPLISWIHANWSFATLFLTMAVAAGAIAAAAWMLPRIPQITGLVPARVDAPAAAGGD